MKKLISVAFISILIIFGVACSSVPETQYYALTPASNAAPINSTLAAETSGIGVGPLVVPNMLDSFSVVSIENSNQISLNPYHLWGGNLKENINQVLADNLSNHLGINGVWPFPWDNRNRPETQVRIFFERFIGERGESITLQAKWTILKDYGRKQLDTQKTTITKSLPSNSYLDYVKALNEALNEFSLEVATRLNQKK